MKKWMIMVLAVMGLILAACSSPTVSTPGPVSNTSASAASAAVPASENLTQTNDEAMVTVAVTPLNLSDKSAATLDFDIALNTHSVDLGYDLTQIATLRSDSGEQVQPTKWNGPTGGGHHREGTLSFPQLKRGQSVTLTLRGIADVPERIFTWKVS
jgi:hypothetical protein